MVQAPAGSFWTVVGVFVLFGPPLGGLALIVRELMRSGPFEFELAMMVMGGSPVAGMLPALATGAMAATISSRIDSRLLWVSAAAALGAGLSALILGQGGLGPTGDVAAVGGVAALGAGLLSLPVRPRWR